MRRVSYFRQIARRPPVAPVVLRPPHQVLRRWEIAQHPIAAAALPVIFMEQEHKTTTPADPLSPTRAAQPDGGATTAQAGMTQAERPTAAPSDPRPSLAARQQEIAAKQLRMPIKEGERAVRTEMAPAREQARVVDYTAPAAPAAPVLNPPPAVPSRPETASIEIGSIEIQLTPPPAPPPPARPPARAAPAPRASLSRDFTQSFGLRQG
jgi:hypothetical protein